MWTLLLRSLSSSFDCHFASCTVKSESKVSAIVMKEQFLSGNFPGCLWMVFRAESEFISDTVLRSHQLGISYWLKFIGFSRHACSIL